MTILAFKIEWPFGEEHCLRNLTGAPQANGMPFLLIPTRSEVVGWIAFYIVGDFSEDRKADPSAKPEILNSGWPIPASANRQLVAESVGRHLGLHKHSEIKHD